MILSFRSRRIQYYKKLGILRLPLQIDLLYISAEPFTSTITSSGDAADLKVPNKRGMAYTSYTPHSQQQQQQQLEGLVLIVDPSTSDTSDSDNNHTATAQTNNQEDSKDLIPTSSSHPTAPLDKHKGKPRHRQDVGRGLGVGQVKRTGAPPVSTDVAPRSMFRRDEGDSEAEVGEKVSDIVKSIHSLYTYVRT